MTVENCIICFLLLTVCCSDDEIKEDRMGGTCDTYGVENKCMQVLLGNLKGTDNLEDIVVAGDRLCGLVVRISGYRYRGLGFDSRRYQIF